MQLSGLVGVRLTANLEAVYAWLDLQESRIRDPLPLLRQTANVLRADARRAFREGGPGWEPLAESTTRQKERKGTAADILIGAGRLRAAWGIKSSTDHLEEIDVKAGTVDVGPDENKIPYAARHQGDGMPRAARIARYAGKISGRGAKERFIRLGTPVRPVTLSRAAEARIRELARLFYSCDPIDIPDS